MIRLRKIEDAMEGDTIAFKDFFGKKHTATVNGWQFTPLRALWITEPDGTKGVLGERFDAHKFPGAVILLEWK